MSARAKGQVLPVVLWIMGIVSIGVGAISLRATHELRLGRIVYEQLQRKAIAQAAIHHAIALLEQDDPSVDHSQEAWATGLDPTSEQPLLKDVAVGRGAFSIGVTDAEGAFQAGLIDEERKLNLNTASPAVISQLILLLNASHEPPLSDTSPQDLAEAIVDWRDEPIGAWCQELPYPCHNGPFDTVEELLLVPWMTSALFAALEPYVTIYGDGLINVNTAQGLVLSALGLPADQLLADREAHPFTSPPSAGLKTTSQFFQVPVEAFVQGSSIGLHLEAVIDRSGTILSWASRRASAAPLFSP